MLCRKKSAEEACVWEGAQQRGAASAADLVEAVVAEDRDEAEGRAEGGREQPPPELNPWPVGDLLKVPVDVGALRVAIVVVVA